MSTSALESRTPEELEREIALTRRSLHSKIHQIEDRLSPTAQFRRVRQQVNPRDYLGVAALGAVVTGAVLAVRGLRRGRPDPLDDIGCEEGLLFVETAGAGDEVHDPPLV